MKQHLIGLTLFSFIVGTAAVIYAVFNVPEIQPVHEIVSTPPAIPAERTYCNMKKLSPFKSLEIKQAVLDADTKEFNWELAVPQRDEMIELLFFVKDGKGTRFLANEKVHSRSARKGVLRFQNSYPWLNSRKSYENLYVIARFESDAVNYEENFEVKGNRFEPRFDAAQATAVTVNFGQTGSGGFGSR